MLLRILMAISLLFFGFAVAGCGVSKQELNDTKVHYTLGVSYLGEPNPTLALKEFLLAEKLNPQDADVQAALGQAYHLKKAYALSEEHYLRALDLHHDNPRYLNNLAALYLDINRYDEAIRCFRQAADDLLFSSPGTAEAGMGYAYFLKGDYVAAVSAYQEALDRNPRYGLAHLRLGEAYFALGKDEEAVREFKQTTAIFPKDAMAYYRLGLAYFKLRQKEKAAVAFRDVLRLAPDSEQSRLAQSYLDLLK